MAHARRVTTNRRGRNAMSRKWPPLMARGFVADVAWPAPAMAATAGKIDSLSGAVNLSRNGVAVGPLAAGTAVNEGDQISTGADSWVLLEMANGDSLTLRGKTRMRMDAYVYPETDNSASRSWLSPLEGAMRSVTGAIGAFNPPSDRPATPIVTLGIRGTDHETADSSRRLARAGCYCLTASLILSFASSILSPTFFAALSIFSPAFSAGPFSQAARPSSAKPSTIAVATADLKLMVCSSLLCLFAKRPGLLRPP
jgi:hypothetical protein